MPRRPPDRTRSRTRWALLVSLGLHLGVLLLLWRTDELTPPVRVVAPAESNEPLVWFDEPAELALTPTEAPPPPRAVPVPVPVEPAHEPEPVPEPDPLELAPTEAERGGAIAEGDPAEGSPGTDEDEVFEAPERLTLTPSLPSTWGTDDPDPRGRTIRNGDPGPDPSAVAAYQGEQAKRRVDGWISNDLAAERAGRGQYDPWFTGMRKALEAEAKDAPGLSKNALQNLFTGWTGALGSYGKTGNPYAEGEIPEESRVLADDSPLNRAADLDRSGGAVRQLRDRLRANAMVRDFAQGKMGAGSRLIALIEIQQDPSGALRSSVLLESSGNREFDRHVTELAPLAVAKLPPPPPDARGVNAGGIRTHWRFEGRIVFLSKPGEQDLASLGTMAGTAALNALTGGLFPVDNNVIVDEVTGESQVVDFSKARLVTRVKLVRIF